jgi:sterol desaturase/sphingolipid hydroxylase (fatty acid hydroxylase superfamily)
MHARLVCEARRSLTVSINTPRAVIDPLLYLTPVFVVALVAEGIWARYDKRALVSALGCAALDQLTAGWGLAIFATAYAGVHGAVGLELSGAWVWIAGVLAHDLAYYAFHRVSHRVTVLWAAHVVHHQSERYDFTVSLRVGSVATWVSYAFYLPVALLVDVHVFLLVHAAYLLFQFFVHTRAIRRLGPLEWLLATPSHHRVHHSSERRHLDRNYGGFFIVFDRLLGTFTREDKEPRYGVPGGFAIASPLFANMYMFARLIAASRGKPLRERLRLWLGPPEHTASLVSAAGHPTRVVSQTSMRRTWLPLALGLAGTAALVVTSLPTGIAIVAGVTCAAMLEVAASSLDGR